MKSFITATATATALMLMSFGTYGATAEIYGKITTIIASDSTIYGGCMVRINSPVGAAAKGLNCPAEFDFVTCSCDGTMHSASEGKRLFDLAQLASLTNKTVRVFVDDTRKMNGIGLILTYKKYFVQNIMSR